MKPKFYVAGRVHDVDRVRAVSKLLKSRGYKQTFDWTVEECQKPYTSHENIKVNRTQAGRMQSAVRESDMFVLLWDSNLTGALVELGMALGDYKDREIHIIGPQHKETIFQSLGNFTVWKSFEAFTESFGAEPEEKPKLEWDSHGRAFEYEYIKVPCPGQPQYGLEHYEPYMDDYGSRVTCRGCNSSSGKILQRITRRREEFDAPRP